MNVFENILYQMEFCLKDDHIGPGTAWITMIPYVEPNGGATIENEDEKSVTVKFFSEVKPSQMRLNLQEAVLNHPGMLLYAEVYYRWPYEIFHDRFVVKDDGRIMEYRTRSEYTEEA